MRRWPAASCSGAACNTQLTTHTGTAVSHARPRRRDLLVWAGSTAALSLSTSCGGAGGTSSAAQDGGSAPGSEEAIAHSWNELTTANAPATFRHVDRLGATRSFARGGDVKVLPAHARSLVGLRYTHGGQSRTLQDFMSRTRNAGLLVLKSGQVALESYGLGNAADSRWTSFSVAKALTATLIGAALEAQVLNDLDVRVDAVLPAFAQGAYGGATVRQLLRMSSGVRWNEDYSSASSDHAALLAAVAQQRAGVALEYIRTRPRAALPGTVWNYNSGDSIVLAALLTALIGGPLSGFVTDRIWSRAGMQSDGYWLLDAPDGLELGGGNFSATLRDYGRLGLFVLSNGQVGSTRVLPAGWRELAGRPDTPLTAPGTLIPGYPLGFGYHWWSLPNGSAFVAQGIFGQFLYLDPAEDLVVVVWSAWPTPTDPVSEAETYALINAAADALR
jgi:CubicO group peptidase (beta-lactamase class C family)